MNLPIEGRQSLPRVCRNNEMKLSYIAFDGFTALRSFAVFHFFIALIATYMSVATSHSTWADGPDFVRDIRPIFEKHCYSCHSETKQKSGLRLDIKSEAFRGGDNYGPSIVAGKPLESPLWELVSSTKDDERMPPDGPGLDATELMMIKSWIDAGSQWPDGVDRAVLRNKLEHWSFQPLHDPLIPDVDDSRWSTNPIDRFVYDQLNRKGIRPNEETDRATWLRRVSLDLTGLPPTRDELLAFLNDSSDHAYENVVNSLLQSKRYGERWAQHWLDVVRYADTHGFEVNTERPNAWPYRDYVIDAFNEDTPYDRFIYEQLVGDAPNTEAATGFLITASVLLPGQIGQDEPSKRLARQDAIDEIVVNIGQSFLGLSIGCARCHDHKFDPISSRDYYAMQSFVAGVEYEDRELHTDAANELRKQSEDARSQIQSIEREIEKLTPIAQINGDDHPASNSAPQHDATETNSAKNIVSFAPIEAKFVRFTIHDANLHPTLGLIEPCIDEFEIFSDDTLQNNDTLQDNDTVKNNNTAKRNLALASNGARVTASGSNTSELHRIEHIHDGIYGNSHSWMSNQPGRGEVTFELPQITRITSIVWGRDREGKFQDRTPTAYTIEAGASLSELKVLKHVSPRRPSVQPNYNADRFAPVKTQRLRLMIEATNNLEPCIDEIEVFTIDSQNIALASRGTTLKTSGENFFANRHEQRFANDGRYGNSSSWMSNETGKGWLELTFAESQTIDRVIWSRDRNKEFADRLATEYRIEIETNEGGWQTVATSRDRQPYDPNSKANDDASKLVAGLPTAEREMGLQLLSRKQSLEARIRDLTNGQLAFAGKFRTPDNIHVLHRGDPEQPKAPVSPTVLPAIGKLELPADTPEIERRRALAQWIANPDNPLTARVMVNRVWQGHFGTGLVDTPSDFGIMGSPPSHPELLDWLAREFVRSGWSIKHLHRLIVLSATYRQSAAMNPDAIALDADTRLLWRFPSRRLEAETLRDSILWINGKLDTKMHGRGFNLFNQRGGLSGFTPIESFQGDGLRRMIYAHKVRREREAVFGAFDCPDAGQSTSRRRESMTPIQALNLFNSRFTLEQSSALADRIIHEVGTDPTQQITRLFEIALSRAPNRDEIEEFKPAIVDHGLSVLCRAILNSNEFVFLP